MTRDPHNRRSGFTLVELLVTIGIIAIVAALLMVAIHAALRGGMKAKAQAEMVNIAGAIKQYNNEYSIWPTPDTNGRNDYTFGGKGHNAPASDNRQENLVISILRALPAFATNNPRHIVFLEVPPNSMVGTDSEGFSYTEGESYYLDPWSNPYLITMDTDFDGEIGVSWLEDPAYKDLGIWGRVMPTLFGGVFPGVQVGVMSYGPDFNKPGSMLHSWGK